MQFHVVKHKFITTHFDTNVWRQYYLKIQKPKITLGDKKLKGLLFIGVKTFSLFYILIVIVISLGQIEKLRRFSFFLHNFLIKLKFPGFSFTSFFRPGK